MGAVMTEQPTNPPETSDGQFPTLLIFLIFPLLGIVAALAIILSSGGERAAAEPTPLPQRLPAANQTGWQDQPAPDFELRTLAQTTARLSDYRGRIVFLNFWATWCIPCERELPTFQQFMSEQQGDASPIILAVNIGETYDHVHAWLSERGVADFPVLLDVSYDTADQYGIGPIPVTFIIDAAGTVRHTKYGEMTRADMDAYLETFSEQAEMSR